VPLGLSARGVDAPAECSCAVERRDEPLSATRTHELAILVTARHSEGEGLSCLFSLTLALDIERSTRGLSIGAAPPHRPNPEAVCEGHRPQIGSSVIPL